MRRPIGGSAHNVTCGRVGREQVVSAFVSPNAKVNAYRETVIMADPTQFNANRNEVRVR